MSSPIVTTSPISLSDVRGTQAADKLKNAEANKGKIEKSAKDFEAVLMAHWLDQAEQSFATVPGGDPDADPASGHDQFQSIAMQAVASAISGHHGGLGIAKMVTSHLEAQHKGEAEPAAELKIKDLRQTPNLAIPLKTGVKK